MKTCDYCGKENDDLVAACSGCGTELWAVGQIQPQAQSGKLALLLICLAGCSSDSGTTYAPMFTEKGFQAIAPGMTSNQVINLLGSPLRVDRQSVSERWAYYDSNQVAPATKTTILMSSGEIISPNRGVSFDSYGTVVSQFGLDDAVLGKDRNFVLRTAGAPSTAESNIANIVLNYTLGGSHHVRAVLLDQKGHVMSKAAF